MFNRFAAKALMASVTAGLIAVSVTPAHAELGAPRSIAVNFTDLDLKSEDGRSQLSRRVAFAAETVCGAADTLSYASKKSVAACRSHAIAGAQQAMVSVFAEAGNTIRVVAN